MGYLEKNWILRKTTLNNFRATFEKLTQRFILTYGHTGFPLYFDTWFFEKQYEFAPANLHHQVEKFLVLLIDAKISKSKIMRNI